MLSFAALSVLGVSDSVLIVLVSNLFQDADLLLTILRFSFVLHRAILAKIYFGYVLL